MHSTTVSKLLVNVTGLHLVFKTNTYRPWTVRDLFVQTLKQGFSRADSIKILNGIDFQLHEGERVGILGPNGAGKTSLCRCIAGFYRPQAGKVQVQLPVRSIFDAQMGIQAELTGRENLSLLANFLYPQISRQQRAEIVEEAATFSGLGDYLDTPFRIYSNGMRAKLALSIVSSRPADILILDEVFDGADRFFKEKVTARVKKMIEDSGAVLFVSHSEEQVRSVCNRVIVLNHGKIVFSGDVEEGLVFYQNMPMV